MTEIETWDGPFHRREIARGEYGKPSKVLEEIEEAEDALDQGQTLMLMIECSDIVGALCGCLMASTEYDPAEEAAVYEQMDPGPYGVGVVDQDPVVNASQQLARMRQILTSDELTQQQVRSLARCALSVAQMRELSWQDLVDFAQLRSRVARYAIAQARAASALAFAEEQEATT